MRLHIISTARAMVVMDTTGTRSARGLDLSRAGRGRSSGAPSGILSQVHSAGVRQDEPGSVRLQVFDPSFTANPARGLPSRMSRTTTRCFPFLTGAGAACRGTTAGASEASTAPANTEPGSFRRTPRFRARAILPESGNMNLARYADLRGTGA